MDKRADAFHRERERDKYLDALNDYSLIKLRMELKELEHQMILLVDGGAPLDDVLATTGIYIRENFPFTREFVADELKYRIDVCMQVLDEKEPGRSSSPPHHTRFETGAEQEVAQFMEVFSSEIDKYPAVKAVLDNVRARGHIKPPPG
jgi:hypothetical protein